MAGGGGWAPGMSQGPAGYIPGTGAAPVDYEQEQAQRAAQLANQSAVQRYGANDQAIKNRQEAFTKESALFDKLSNDPMYGLQGLYGATNIQGSNPATVDISMPDMQAANAAIFGRAKEQVGQETSAGLTGLRAALAGRGMLGSGAESRGTTGIITKGQGELGDITRENAITNSGQAMDVAKTAYQGAITQRGQDIANINQQNQLKLEASKAYLVNRQSQLAALAAAMNSASQVY